MKETKDNVQNNKNKQAEAYRLFKWRLKGWARLTPEKIQATLLTKESPLFQIYSELFGNTEQKKSASVGLENFQKTLQHALRMLSSEEHRQRLYTSGYLYFEKSPSQELRGAQATACTYEIYCDQNGHYILSLHPLIELVVPPGETAFWERQLEKRYGFPQLTFAIGSSIEWAYTLTAHGEQCADLLLLADQTKKMNSIFIQSALLGPLSPQEEKTQSSSKKMRMIMPLGVRLHKDWLKAHCSYFTCKQILRMVVSIGKALHSIHQFQWAHGKLSLGHVVLGRDGAVSLSVFSKVITTPPLTPFSPSGIQQDIQDFKRLIADLDLELPFSLPEAEQVFLKALRNAMKEFLLPECNQIENYGKIYAPTEYQAVQIFFKYLQTKSDGSFIKEVDPELKIFETIKDNGGVFGVSSATEEEEKKMLLSTFLGDVYTLMEEVIESKEVPDPKGSMDRLLALVPITASPAPSASSYPSVALFSAVDRRSLFPPTFQDKTQLQLYVGRACAEAKKYPQILALKMRYALRVAAEKGWTSFIEKMCFSDEFKPIFNDEDWIAAANLIQEHHPELIAIVGPLLDQAVELALKSSILGFTSSFS